MPITNKSEFHAARAEYLACAERDAKYIESGRRGWNPAAKRMVQLTGELTRYCVEVTKRGHGAQACIDALGDEKLASYYAQMLWADRSLHAQWIDALRINGAK